MIIAIIIMGVVLAILLAIITWGDGLEMFIDAKPNRYFRPTISINRYRKSWSAPCDHCLVRDDCEIYQTSPVVLLPQIEECDRRVFYGGRLK